MALTRQTHSRTLDTVQDRKAMTCAKDASTRCAQRVGSNAGCHIATAKMRILAGHIRHSAAASFTRKACGSAVVGWCQALHFAAITDDG